MIAWNYRTFNEPRKAKITWVYTAIATILIFGCVFLLLDDIVYNFRIPKFLIPFVYALPASWLVRHFQGRSISAHIDAGGKAYRWWGRFAVGLTGLAISLALIVGFAFLSDASLTTKTYGITKNEIRFNKNRLTEAEVDRLAEGLIKTNYFNDRRTKHVTVKKRNTTYELHLPAANTIGDYAEKIMPLLRLRRDLQALFPDNKIVLDFRVGCNFKRF